MAQLKALHATEMLNALPNHEQRLKGRALRTGGLFDQVEFFYSPVKGDAVDLQQTGGFGLIPGGFVESFQGGTGIDPLRLASGRAPHGVFEFADIARPGILGERLEDIRGDGGNVLLEFSIDGFAKSRFLSFRRAQRGEIS
jgi:hypothetical protein